MQIIHTIKILRRPADVFPWIGNPDKAMKWQTNVSGGRIREQTEGMVGTTFEETISDNKGSTTLRGVITKWGIDKLVAFQLDGKYNRAEIEFQLESENGYTIVTQRAKIQFKSATRLVMLILGPFFKKKIARELADQFTKLKDLCENRMESNR